MQEPGRTVVHLTLLPSMTRAAASPEERQTVSHPENIIPEKSIQEALPEPDTSIASTAVATAEEHITHLTEDQGIISAESLPGATMPPYPRVSRRRGEEGTVILAIEVLANGKAGGVKVIESSGYRRLDKAAVNAAKEAAYQPAISRGRDVDSILTQPFVFELTQ
ncbi:MAG: energy transducer TonB [Pontiella sp.]|nr:energy transducer TonB [Pontiella sp.]